MGARPSAGVFLICLVLKEYDIWAMEIEHYLEYIDNDVWKGRLLRKFHVMDDAKEIWEAIRTSSEGLEKGYDRFQQLLSQLEAHGVEVSTEDANHKFLRSLHPACFWQENSQVPRKISYCKCSERMFLFHKQEHINKVKSGHTGATYLYSSTSSNSFQEREVSVVLRRSYLFYSLPINLKRLGLAHARPGNRLMIIDIERGNNTGRSYDCYSNEEVSTKQTGESRIDGQQNLLVLTKRSLNVFKCHNHVILLENAHPRGQIMMERREILLSSQALEKKEPKLETVADYWMMDEVVKEKEQLQKIVDLWKNSSKKLWRLVDLGMTSNNKVGLGYEIQSNKEVLSYEEEMNRTVFKCTKGDFLNKPLYSRFSKTGNFKGVPHPLTGDYTPKPQEEIDDSLYVYGKKGPQKPKISYSDDNSTEHSTCQSNDSEGSFGNSSEHSSESESESIHVPNEISASKPVTANEKVCLNQKKLNLVV
ncbi:hypothetical protein Tco_1219630 [Tanacetum coccineum]